MTPKPARILITAAVAAVTLLCAAAALVASAAHAADPTAAGKSPMASWAAVLSRFVNERGEVDFPALVSDRADLDRYVQYVASTRFDSLTDGPERLAHMINAYNALSMVNVLDSGIPTSHAGFNKRKFFVLRKQEIGGERMSLRTYENDVIRPYARSRDEPRIHFALNCSALACPALPRMPFTAAGLDAELERGTREFFARPENFRVDAAAGTVWLSELLDFYPEDFVPRPATSLLDYANRYAPQLAPAAFKVRFTPYDWTIANSRRAR